MYVEDQTSYNGPIQVTVKPDFTLAELKEHVQCEFEIPVGVQKWILGKSLAEDDHSKLSSHGITQSGQSIYLYLVAPKEEENKELPNEAKTQVKSPQILKKPIEKDMEEHRKGRYWNYEMDRWSYCSSEEEDEIVEPVPKGPENKENGDINEESGESEWEYFYEDAEMKPEPQKEFIAEVQTEVKPKVNPRNGWVCPTCTLLNEPHRPGCEACTTERPKDYEVPPPGPADTIPRGATAVAPRPNTNTVINATATPKATNNAVVGATAAKEPVPSRLKPLVEVKSEKEVKKPETVTKEKDNILNNYKKLDDLDIIPNAEQFECIICYLDIEPGDGVVLRECLHTFCK